MRRDADAVTDGIVMTIETAATRRSGVIVAVTTTVTTDATAEAIRASGLPTIAVTKKARKTVNELLEMADTETTAGMETTAATTAVGVTIIDGSRHIVRDIGMVTVKVTIRTDDTAGMGITADIETGRSSDFRYRSRFSAIPWR